MILKKIKTIYKNGRKNIKVDDTEIQEYEFQSYKSSISISNIGINEIVVTNKFPLDKKDYKYFIGYKDDKDIRPLCIFFPEMRIYKRYSDKTKCIYFMIEDEQNFDIYNNKTI